MTTKYLILAVLLMFGVYGCMEAWPIVAGPSLSITSPRNGTPFPNGVVAVRGTAARAAELTLNGASLLHDQDGDFSSTLTFPRGGSILTFAAVDRFGRIVTATRTIFVP